MSSSINIYFFIAGILCFILGVAHSILGEVLIFKSIRKNKTLPKENHLFQRKYIGIIWATWHLASIFGFAFGGILLQLSSDEIPSSSPLMNTFVIPIMIATCLSALLVLFSTKGRHPGWIVLLLISILIFLGK